MAAKHQPKHRAPKRRRSIGLSVKRPQIDELESSNGQGPDVDLNGRASHEGLKKDDPQVRAERPSSEDGEIPERDGDSNTLVTTDTQHLPVADPTEPEAKATQVYRIGINNTSDGAQPDSAPRRFQRPRSAAAEEFLKETPEFNLTRNKDKAADARARTKEHAAVPAMRKPKEKAAARRGSGKKGADGSREEEQSLGQWFREITILGLIAISSALFLTTYVVQAFFIPSESMEDTLQVNDRVLVNKLAYRFGDPEPRDIVVFAAKSDQIAQEQPDSAFGRGFNTVATALGLKSSSQDLIKRVIAVQGQTVEIRVGLLYVDGEEVQDEPYRKDFLAMDDYGPTTVPEGHVFVMGDNRRNSSDSRVFGPIPQTALVGKAFARIWPLERFQWFSG